MTKYLFVFVFLFLISCNHPESKEFGRYHSNENSQFTIEKTADFKVIGIKDGDTFVVLVAGKEQVVRLEHIDCPEKNQPFGRRAKQFASDLCFGKYVQLDHKNIYDRNKRLIAEIILENGVNINKELVNNGLAWHFKKYSNDNDYAVLEASARNNQIGLWAIDNPIPPWEFRKNKKNKK